MTWWFKCSLKNGHLGHFSMWQKKYNNNDILSHSLSLFLLIWICCLYRNIYIDVRSEREMAEERERRDSGILIHIPRWNTTMKCCILKTNINIPTGYWSKPNGRWEFAVYSRISTQNLYKHTDTHEKVINWKTLRVANSKNRKKAKKNTETQFHEKQPTPKEMSRAQEQ